MNILVTGGAGFIGSHVADAYVSAGHTVSIVDDLSTGKNENVSSHVEFHRCDLRDQHNLEKVFRGHRYDLLNHHAAQTDVRRSVADPAFDASVNIQGFLGLMECCVRYGVSKVVLASTGGAIYGKQDFFPADESHPTRPISPYGVAKLASERYLFYYHAVRGVNVTALRYANVYGPRQNPHGEAGVVAIFANRLLGKTTPVINGDGKQTRDYVFVGDVAAANVLALTCDGFQVFNVGTGVETDVNDLFELLASITGSNILPEHGEGKPGEQQRSVLDSGRISHLLGWKPSVSLKDGLKTTVDFLRKQAMR